MLKTKVEIGTPSRQKYKRTIKLLSGGYTAPDSFPDGTITVYPWDANVDEWLVERAQRNDDSGNLLIELLPQLCDLNKCPLGKFVYGEVNLVLLVARSIRHDCKLEMDIKCPECKAKFVQPLVIPDQLGKLGEKVLGYPGYDEITLPVCGDVVRLRPLLVQDQIFVSERDPALKKAIPNLKALTAMTLLSVGGGAPDAHDESVAYLDALHPKDRNYYSDQVRALTPSLDMEIGIKCECSHKITQTIDIGAEFFRSGRISIG